MPDAKLARKLGLSTDTVCLRRHTLGVEPFRDSIAGRRMEWTEQGLALLGKLPDTEVAKMLGVTFSAVSEKRMVLGIPACHASQPQRKWTKAELALLGKLYDTEVARRLGRGRRHVQAKRRALGIPSKRAKDAQMRWTKASLNRLGKVPDAQLAAEMGLSLMSVQWHRRGRGIPRCESHVGPASRRKGGRPVRESWTPERVKKLGTVPDVVIAREMGLTKSAVAAYRARLGIMPCCR